MTTLSGIAEDTTRIPDVEQDIGDENAAVTDAQAALERATAEQDVLDAQETRGVENSGLAAVQ